MSFATDLMGAGLAPEQAIRLGYSALTSITTAGTTQGTATAIPKIVNNALLVTAGSQTGAILPSTAEMMVPYVVTNSTATTGVVYPPTSGTINSGAANAGVNISQNESVTFIRLSTNRWIAASTANPSILGSSNTWTGANQFDNTVTVGADGTGYDVLFYSATAGKSFLWDESADTLIVTGTSSLQGDVNVGVNGTGFDVNLFGDTAGQKFFWDQSLDTAFMTCTVDIDGTVTVGVDDTGYDVTFFTATTGKSWFLDESLDKVFDTTALAVRGVLTGLQGAPTAKTVTSAITAAELLTGIITTTGATAPSIHQLPTGTLLAAQFPGIAVGDCFDFTIINTGTGASDDATITVNTDVTIVGNPTVGSLTDATIISGSGRFRARYTAANTFVVYRLS